MEYEAVWDIDDLLRSYFRLDEDIAAVRADLADRDQNLARLMEKVPIPARMRQPEPWEYLVTYICSANNNVKRTSGIVESIARRLGHRVKLEGETRHGSPTSHEIRAAGEGVLGG